MPGYTWTIREDKKTVQYGFSVKTRQNLHGVPSKSYCVHIKSSYLRFSDEMLGQLDDGEVAAADGAADLVEPHAQQLIGRRLLLRSRSCWQ